MTSLLLNAALALQLAATAAGAPGTATVHMDTDTLVADAAGGWTVPFTLKNPGEYGLFGDSLFVDVTNLDPGRSRAPRTNTVSFAFLIRQMGTLGAGEEKPISFTIPSSCEHAKLVVRLYMHGGGGGPAYAFRESLLAEPGAASLALPSSFVTVKGRKVELVAGTGAASGSAPGVLLVPSETAHARRLVPTIQQLVLRGMNAVAVSPPGYGQSDGPADMAGPATVAALEAGLAKLVAMPGTDRKQLAVWGTGRGATAALLLAARHPEIGKVIALDAGYDLWATWRAADPATAANIAAEAGKDSAGWAQRSPLVAAAKLRGPVLVMHGLDPLAPVEPARAFAAARWAAGAPVDTLWAPHGARRLRRDPLKAGLEFLSSPAHP